MTLDPIATANLTIQIHVVSAMLALILGPVALYRRRRDRWHRWLGIGWVLSMAVLSVSGLFIVSDVFPIIGPFGPIHILCVAVLAGLWRGIVHIRAGRVAQHAAMMRGLFWQAMGIAGLLTLIPGRLMNQVLFPDTPALGWLLIGGIIVLVLTLSARGRFRTAMGFPNQPAFAPRRR